MYIFLARGNILTTDYGRRLNYGPTKKSSKSSSEKGEEKESATRKGSQGHEREDVAAPELAPVLEGDKCMKLDR